MASVQQTHACRYPQLLSVILLVSLAVVKASFADHQHCPTNFPNRSSCSPKGLQPLRRLPILGFRSGALFNTFHKNNGSHVESGDEDNIDKYADDVAKVLNELRPAPLDVTIPAVFRSKSLSFTRLWSLEDWTEHTSRWRYIRHFTGLTKSRLLRRILPQLMVLTVWSICAAVLRSRSMVGEIPLSSISLVSTFVAALLTLRSNHSLSRLSDGRTAFGKAILYTRDSAQMIASSVYPKDKRIAMIMIRHLALFVWLLKSHLRDTPENDIVRTMLPNPQDANYIVQHRKPPVAALSKLRQCVNHLVEEGLLSTADNLELEHHIVELNHVIMTTERIRASPIPPLYTSHTGRLLMINLVLLPLALASPSPFIRMGKVVSVVVTTVLAGFAMLGLDEISHSVEQPFRLMPLYQIAKLAMMDVSDAIVCQPPPLALLPPTPLHGGDKKVWSADVPLLSEITPPSRPAYW